MTITKFIKKEAILLILLIIMLINPFYYGYRIAILLVFVLFLKFYHTLKLLDKNVLYLFLFGVFYHLISANRIDSINKSILSILPDVFLPAIIYMVGKVLSTAYKSEVIRIFFLFFIILFFSIVPAYSIIYQIITDGFVGNRSLYLIWDKNEIISATGLGSYFTLNMAAIALLNSPKISRFQNIISFLVFLLFLISLICVLRLGNRTQLLIGLISIIISFFFNFNRMSTLSKSIQFIIFGSIIGYISYLFVVESELIIIYQDRIGDSEAGEIKLGGRLVKWKLALESILSDPWGWEKSRFGYSHNLWLDVVRVSGIIALIPLVFFSVSSFKLFLKSLTIIKKQNFLRTYIFVFYVSIFSQFFIEPIMEGIYLLFFIFCLFVGFLAGITSNDGRIRLNEI